MAGDDAVEWQARALAAFNRIDVDNSDSLSKDELVMMLETGAFPMADTVQDTAWTADRLMEVLDTDGDGSISRDEFLKFINSPDGTLGAMSVGPPEGDPASWHMERRMSEDSSWLNSLLAKVVVAIHTDDDGEEIVDDELFNKAALQTKITSRSLLMAGNGLRSRNHSNSMLDDGDDEYDVSFSEQQSADDDTDGSVEPSALDAEYARRLDELETGTAELGLELDKERGLREAAEAKVVANEREAVELKVQLEMAKITAAAKQTEFQGMLDELRLELRKARNDAVVIKNQLGKVGGQKAATGTRLRTMLDEHKKAMAGLARVT